MSMIHEITAGATRNKLPKRKGRGRSQGQGKTAGRGGKGASARGGGPYWKPGHEGGQTAMHRRMPKRGFSNFKFQNHFHIVNVSDLDNFTEGTTVDAATLHDAGFVPDLKFPVKVLGEGAIVKKLTVVAGWFSKSAREKILQAGGSPQNLKGLAFEFPKPKKKFIPRDDVKKPKKKIDADAPAEAPAAAAEAPKAE